MKSQLLLHENTSSSKRGQNLSQPSNLCPGSTLELHFQCSLSVQSHSVRSNSLREQVPFSSALARFSSPLELFPDRRAAIARMYVFICEAKLIACLPCVGAPFSARIFFLACGSITLETHILKTIPEPYQDRYRNTHPQTGPVAGVAKHLDKLNL